MFTSKGKYKKTRQAILPLEATQQDVICPTGTGVACHAFHFPFYVHDSLLCPYCSCAHSLCKRLAYSAHYFAHSASTSTATGCPHFCSPAELMKLQIWRTIYLFYIKVCAKPLSRGYFAPVLTHSLQRLPKLLAGGELFEGSFYLNGFLT